MILLAAFVVSLLIALLRGGKLRKLGQLSFHGGWLIALSFVMQAFVIYGPAGKGRGIADPAVLLNVASYLLLAVVVWQNRRLPGMKLIAIGLLMNLTVIVANGGFMPIEPAAVRRIGHADRAGMVAAGYRVRGAKDVILPKEQTRLWLLSDVFVIPPPFPIPTAFSPGDLFVAAGAFILLQRAMIGLPAEPVRPARQATNHIHTAL
jgi:hypothetical protein